MNDTDFKPVYNEGNPVFPDHFICNHCGNRIERGIVNISTHWMECEKRTAGLIIAKNDFEKKILDSWSINSNSKLE